MKVAIRQGRAHGGSYTAGAGAWRWAICKRMEMGHELGEGEAAGVRGKDYFVDDGWGYGHAQCIGVSGNNQDKC